MMEAETASLAIDGVEHPLTRPAGSPPRRLPRSVDEQLDLVMPDTPAAITTASQRRASPMTFVLASPGSHVLDISVKTVQHHLARIMDKLEIHDRVELARFAIREGIVEP